MPRTEHPDVCQWSESVRRVSAAFQLTARQLQSESVELRLRIGDAHARREAPTTNGLPQRATATPPTRA
jgi:hypothetical protein